MTGAIPTDAVRFVPELYPRIRPSDEVIDRYRAAIDQLPPITVARGGVLVDGYHRWQAHLREGRIDIPAENLGDLTDTEILHESYRRNARHGHQLSAGDKRRAADHLFRNLGGKPDARYDTIVELLGVTRDTAVEFCRDAKRDEKERLVQTVIQDWLDNPQDSAKTLAKRHGIADETVADWTARFSNSLENLAPESRQHFDLWQFLTNDDTDGTYYGRLSPQVVENLLWLYSEPGDIVVDPFAGSGITIEVAKRMGRRIYAWDRTSAKLYPHLPIHTWDTTAGWPPNAPAKAQLAIVDPPYWKQAAGRYSQDPEDLGNQTLDDFYASWAKVCSTLRDRVDRIAFIVSPAQDGALADGRVEDLAHRMYRIAEDLGWAHERRIIATYNQSNQATGQAVDAAKLHRRLLKAYRDIVVMR